MELMNRTLARTTIRAITIFGETDILVLFWTESFRCGTE
jgi:hypothetical protein